MLHFSQRKEIVNYIFQMTHEINFAKNFKRFLTKKRMNKKFCVLSIHS